MNENWFGVINNFVTTLGGVLTSSNNQSSVPTYVPGSGGVTTPPPPNPYGGVNTGDSNTFTSLTPYMPLIIIAGLFLILKK